MSFDPEPFSFVSNTLHWVFAFGTFLGFVLVGVCLLSLLTNGPSGPQLVLKWIPRFLGDVRRMSVRRIGAVAQLTLREAIRRKALWVFGIFALLFMFGSWFLDDSTSRADLQVKNYISFVLRAITWLILPVVLLISCWGLPEDIRNRSLHTVVTKPVRKTEIVFGRMLGFTWVATILVVIMGAVGFFWIDREVSHNLNAFTETLVDGGVEKSVAFAENKDGVTVTVTVEEKPTRTTVTGLNQLRQDNPDVYRLVEQARRQALNRHLVARRPVYGSLSFRGSDGRPTEKGVNTGDVWEYRTYIEGGKQWRAIWDFESINEETFGTALKLESSFEAFRTHKGDEIEKSLLCQYSLAKIKRTAYRFPDGRFVSAIETTKLPNGKMQASYEGVDVDLTEVPIKARDVEVREGRYVLVDDKEIVVDVLVQARVPLASFNISEFGENITTINREIVFYDPNTGEPKHADLFDDLVNDLGELRVEVACLDSGQYLGMARNDLFLKLANHRFIVGYSKAVLGLWLMMVMVVVLGVTASCFLKGQIAATLTFVILIVGQKARTFLEEIVGGEVAGGGPLESIIRIVRQINLTDDLPDTAFYKGVAGIDEFLNQGLWIVKNMVPDFRHFEMSKYVANGFDVPWSQALAPSIAVTLAYLLPCLMIGYYSLSLRELEHK